MSDNTKCDDAERIEFAIEQIKATPDMNRVAAQVYLHIAIRDGGNGCREAMESIEVTLRLTRKPIGIALNWLLEQRFIDCRLARRGKRVWYFRHRDGQCYYGQSYPDSKPDRVAQREDLAREQAIEFAIKQTIALTNMGNPLSFICLLYTSDAADE